MGLVNAPATFQTYINQALAGLVDVTCIVYLDDILIFSDDEAAHEQHVREVLDRLRRADLYANEKKCRFHTTEVSFLGYVVSPEGISMEPERVEAIAQWPLPRSVHDIQVFTGFTGFYRRFIRGYSIVCAPLTDLLRGDQKRQFILTDAAKDAFSLLIRLFQEAPILRHFDPRLPIRVESDASQHAVGAVLSQLHDGVWHPVAFRSRKLTGEETRYGTGDGELVGIVDAFKAWRHYLLYSQTPVLVLTDHLNLTSLRDKKKPSQRQLRWTEDLAIYDFVVKYRPGVQNAADGLSRRPDHAEKEQNSTPEDAENPLFTLMEERVARGLDYTPKTASLPAIAAAGLSALKRGPTCNSATAAVGMRPANNAICSMVGSSRGEERTLGFRAAEDVLELEVADGLPLDQNGEAIEPGRVSGQSGVKRPADDALPVRGRRVDVCSTFTTGGRCRCPESDRYDTDATSPRRPFVGAASAVRNDKDGSARSSGSAGEKSLEERVLAAQQDDPWVAAGAWKKLRGRWTREGENGLLAYNSRIFVPANCRKELLARYHDDATAGHRGIKTTEKRISRHWYWDSIRADVEEHVNACATCSRTKPKNHRPYGVLAPLPIPEEPWQDITVDFVTGLPPSVDPRTNRSCDAILVIVDKLTKYSLYIATHKQLKASAFADLFFDHVFRPFGMPRAIVSDRGSLFTSHFWEALCSLLATDRRLSTAYHPQTDGQTERQNQNLEHYLRTYCSYDQADWAQHLMLAEHVYNTSYHTATRTTPAYLLYGYQPRGPSDPLAPTRRHVPAAEKRADEILRGREHARKILLSANEGYEKWYNKKRLDQHFEVNQWVWLSTKHLNQKRPSRKLADKYIGPFKIVAVVGDKKMAYRLDLPPRYRIHPTFPISLLEPFKGTTKEAEAHRESVDVEPEERHWVVEAILDHRGPARNRQYLIKWEGYGEESNSWEPRVHLDEGPLLREYEARLTRAHLRRGV
jgi:transposase InsO family protein